MQPKQFWNIATKVSSRDKCYYFWWSTWLLINRVCRCYTRERVTKLFMMTSSNGNIFRVTGPLCGEFTGPGEFPTQRPVTRSLDVFFDLRLNKRLSKQPWGWWFETLSWSLWRHCNVDCENTQYHKVPAASNHYPWKLAVTWQMIISTSKYV